MSFILFLEVECYMARVLKFFIGLLTLLSIFFIIQYQRDESSIIYLLENQYANLELSHKDQKREILNKIKTLSDAKGSDDLEKISNLLNQMNDGHLSIKSKVNQPVRTNGIEFYPSSEYIRKCDQCLPQLKQDKYKIIEIDDVEVEKWLLQMKWSVHASTDWGRRYRLFRSLNQEKIKMIKVKDSSNRNLKIQLKSTLLETQGPQCVRSRRISKSKVLIELWSFWCQENESESRKVILNRFKAQFDKAINAVNDNDQIILDLRENGGGGDDELKYALSFFFSKKVDIYQYQYLKKTEYGYKRSLYQFLNTTNPWAEKITESLNPGPRFLKNHLNVLIGPGCFSSCDLMASVLKDLKRAKLYGEKTHGGVGDPREYTVFDGQHIFVVPACKVWTASGQIIEGVGIEPDILMTQDANGREDSVLEFNLN